MTTRTKRQLLELIADQSEELSACYARERKAVEDRAKAERSAAINLEQSCRAGVALRDKFAELQADLQAIARAAGLEVTESTTVGDIVAAVEGLRVPVSSYATAEPTQWRPIRKMPEGCSCVIGSPSQICVRSSSGVNYSVPREVAVAMAAVLDSEVP